MWSRNTCSDPDNRLNEIHIFVFLTKYVKILLVPFVYVSLKCATLSVY